MTKELTTLLLISSVLFASAMTSWIKCDWVWFSRSGALIVLIGLLVQSRVIITHRSNFEIPFWKDQDTRKAIRNGFIAVCLGTLIWGFGDLVTVCLK